jgi:hypothetical protein
LNPPSAISYLVTLFNIEFPSTKRLRVGALKLDEQFARCDDQEKFFARDKYSRTANVICEAKTSLVLIANILHLKEEIHWICNYGQIEGRCLRLACQERQIKSPETRRHHKHRIGSLLKHHLHLRWHHLTLMHHLQSTGNLSHEPCDCKWGEKENQLN